METAKAHFNKGMVLEKQGQYDIALTEYRRAVLADPKLVVGHLSVGRLCKKKGEIDPLFMRYAYESFQKAAHLDLNNKDAHDTYITFSQKLNRLDNLLQEYDEWLKANPENENLIRCRKNVLTISMTMIPDKISVESGGSNQKIRKALLILCIGSLFFGLVIVASPLLLGKKISKQQSKNLIRVGIMMCGVSVLGFAGRSLIK